MQVVDMATLGFVLDFSVAAFLLCGILLWLRRDDGDRSRLFLAAVWILISMAFFLRSVLVRAGVIESGSVMPLLNLSGGLLAIIILYLYPVEVISPGWLTLKRGFLMFSPWIFLVLCLTVFPVRATPLQSFADIVRNINEPDVWLRLAILVVLILPYCAVLLVIPYNWRRSRVSNAWIVRYTVTVALIAVLYFIFMLTGSAAVSIAHLSVCTVFCIVITYQELFIRFSLPREDTGVPEPVPDAVFSGAGKSLPQKRPGLADPLMEKLDRLMKDEEVWRSPEMSAVRLAALIDTNTRYLSQALKDAGYENYSDFINSYRIDCFLELARQGKIKNVYDAFFYVGFRSKATALRCFRKRTGTTPSEYLRITE